MKKLFDLLKAKGPTLPVEEYPNVVTSIIRLLLVAFSHQAHDSGERLYVELLQDGIAIYNKDDPRYSNTIMLELMTDHRMSVARYNNHPQREQPQLMELDIMTVPQACALIEPLVARLWDRAHSSMRSLERLRLS